MIRGLQSLDRSPATALSLSIPASSLQSPLSLKFLAEMSASRWFRLSNSALSLSYFPDLYVTTPALYVSCIATINDSTSTINRGVPEEPRCVDLPSMRHLPRGVRVRKGGRVHCRCAE
eukprot:1217522-Rhodomonas_salina.1